MLFEQQAWPARPHDTLAPLEHTVPPSPRPLGVQLFEAVSVQAPAAHPVVGQTGSKAPPHEVQTLLLQTVLVALQLFPAQQACPRPPQPAH